MPGALAQRLRGGLAGTCAELSETFSDGRGAASARIASAR